MKIIDTELTWKGHGRDYEQRKPELFDSCCQLRIYRQGDQAIVIFTASLGEDTGCSITNASEGIAAMTVEQYQLDPNKTTWIEHYDDSEAEFSQVMYNWRGGKAENARWRCRTRQQVEALIGERL